MEDRLKRIQQCREEFELIQEEYKKLKEGNSEAFIALDIVMRFIRLEKELTLLEQDNYYKLEKEKHKRRFQ